MIIQRLLLPTGGVGLPQSHYVAESRGARVCQESGAIDLSRGGMIVLHSYFNTVDLTVWGRVVETREIGLRIGYRGDLRVAVDGYSHLGGGNSAIERHLVSTTRETAVLDGLLGEFPAGPSRDIVSLRFSSETGATLHAADWYIQRPPIDGVKVGIIITHFNRHEWVLPAVERLREGLLEDSEFAGNVHLVIADNSRNLPLANSEYITVLPSPNFGGSGGFSRGLLHLQDVGGFTHGIFMDDDATCEIESIKRAIRFLQLNRNEALAISGALFCDPDVDRIHEAGASWTDTWRPRCAGVRPVGEGLLELVAGPSAATYGGWWFFAFSLTQEISWPFPFFIRGDDVCFSLANKYEIISPLGVACRAENFDGKDNISLKYLEARMHTMPALVFGTCALIPLLRRLNTICFCSLESYRYAAAEVFLHGVQDCLGSERYWLENIDSLAYRERYARLFAEETYSVQEPTSDLVTGPRFKESTQRKLLRYLTLGGHLIPRWGLPQGRVLTEKSWSIANYAVFPHYRMRIQDALSGKSWDTERDIPRLLRILWRMLLVDLQVARAFLFQRDKYRRIYENLSTRESWERIFSTAVSEKKSGSA